MRAMLALTLLVACSEDGDTMLTVDAATQPADASGNDNCLVPASWGDVGAKTGTAGNMGGVSATFTLDAGPPRDTFFLKMVTGKGVFSGGIAPGTYTISGVDADYNNCGLCVHIIADIVAGSGPSKFYFANTGTVTLTSTTPPISGSASNLTFREVDLSTGAPVQNGCASAMAAISFTTN